MNKKQTKVCEEIENLYKSNPEFYRFIREVADHTESYSKMPNMEFTCLTMTIIALWELEKDKFWKPKVEDNKK